MQFGNENSMIITMKTFAINTLGCKVNQYESQQIRQLLEDSILKQVELTDSPDLVVINTCCVTHIASSKSRQAIRKAQKHNPNAKIVIAGCLPAGHTGELDNIQGDVTVIDKKNALLDVLNGIIASKNNPHTTSKPILASKIKNKNDLSDDIALSGYHLRQYKGQSRAFVKVQDGCDGYCSYCIVPKTRNTLYNKPQTQVLDEVAKLVYAGHKEIVLTGIFLGAYGRDTVRRKKWEKISPNPLADLIDKTASVDGLKRLRLSSLEPGDVTNELLDVFCKHDNIMPHLHLPLQSGSAHILRKMCRQYTIEDFMQSVAKLKDRLDRPAITTDIIVGFPGETDEDFKKTCYIARQMGFSKIHVFSYSRRKNTPAYNMDNQLTPDIIKERSKILRDIDLELQNKFRNKFIGEQVGIIVEQCNPVRGRTERYFMVEFDKQVRYNKGKHIFGTLQNDGWTASIF